MGHIWSEVQREASDHETKQVAHPGELEVGVGESPAAPPVCSSYLEKETKQQNGAELKLLGSVQSELEVVPDW